MKLYSWVRNERGVTKTQGGARRFEIDLEYEENGQSWECNTSEHETKLTFAIVAGVPTIHVAGNKTVKIVDCR